MTERLNVLIIEDCEDDAILAVRRLKMAGYEVSHTVVEDEAGLRAALDTGDWDLILSDYTLPAFDARDALAIVRESQSELPFVVVSGTIGDERATELMREGASDYVLKDHAQRFGPVVKRALGDARERALLDAAQGALVIAGQEWLDTFEAISDGVLVLDESGRIERCNVAATHLLRTERSALKGSDALHVIADSCGIEVGVDEWLLPQRVELERGPCEGSGAWLHLSSDPVRDVDDDLVGFVVVIVDITQRKRAEEELIELVARLGATLRGTVKMAARMVESRDPYTAGHQEQVADFGVEIAKRMKLSAEQVEAVRIAGLMHDIGKIGVPAEILVKPAGLTDVEWSLVRQHPVLGAEIIGEVEFDQPIAQIVRQHHERLDGTGYPDGLKGDEICLEARIIAVADVAEAMLAHRPYRPACSMSETVRVLSEGRGSLWDEAAVDAMLEHLSEVETGVSAAPRDVLEMLSAGSRR